MRHTLVTDFATVAASARARWQAQPFPWTGKGAAPTMRVSGFLFFLITLPLCLVSGVVLAAAALWALLPASWLTQAAHLALVPAGVVVGAFFARAVWRNEVVLERGSDGVTAWEDRAVSTWRGHGQTLRYDQVRDLGPSDELVDVSGHVHALGSLPQEQRQALLWLYILPACAPKIAAEIRAGHPLVVGQRRSMVVVWLSFILVAGILAKVTPLLAVALVAVCPLVVRYVRNAIYAPKPDLVCGEARPHRRPLLRGATREPLQFEQEGITCEKTLVLPWREAHVLCVQPDAITLGRESSRECVCISAHERNFPMAAAVLEHFLPGIDLSPIAASFLAPQDDHREGCDGVDEAPYKRDGDSVGG